MKDKWERSLHMHLMYKARREALFNASTEEQKAHVMKVRTMANERLRKRREEVNRFKMRPCADCNVQYAPWVMQFDHIQAKTKIISHMLGGPIDKIKAEIAKCEVVCANCHFERTHARGMSHKKDTFVLNKKAIERKSGHDYCDVPFNLER